VGCGSDLKSCSHVSQIQLLEIMVHWMASGTACSRSMWDTLSIAILPKWQVIFRHNVDEILTFPSSSPSRLIDFYLRRWKYCMGWFRVLWPNLGGCSYSLEQKVKQALADLPDFQSCSNCNSSPDCFCESPHDGTFIISSWSLYYICLWLTLLLQSKHW
jgi:hypothetical protein